MKIKGHSGIQLPRPVQRFSSSFVFTFLHPLENVQIGQFFELLHTLRIRFNDFFIVEQYPAVWGSDVSDVMPGMDGRSFV